MAKLINGVVNFSHERKLKIEKKRMEIFNEKNKSLGYKKYMGRFYNIIKPITPISVKLAIKLRLNSEYPIARVN